MNMVLAGLRMDEKNKKNVVEVNGAYLVILELIW